MDSGFRSLSESEGVIINSNGEGLKSSSLPGVGRDSHLDINSSNLKFDTSARLHFVQSQDSVQALQITFRENSGGRFQPCHQSDRIQLEI